MEQKEAKNVEKKYRFLFGPVPSRRFGRSLGVDLTPFKTCNFNCIFCQLGPTPCPSAVISELVPTQAVIDEFKDWIKNDGQADQITFAGSGEPTLHIGIGEIIREIRQSCSIPVAVLSNGAGMINPEVRKNVSEADIVKVSLSAWNEESFQIINRPAAGISLAQTVEGEMQLRKEFKGKLFLECFLIDGINAEPEKIREIARLAGKIKPDLVQLNTSVRPPAESMAKAVTPETMKQLASLFQPAASVIESFKTAQKAEVKCTETMIFDMIRRRPCTASQIAEVFSMHLNHVAKFTGNLIANGKIKPLEKSGQIYFVSIESIALVPK